MELEGKGKMSELNRLKSRFDRLFSDEGLTNVKFFIKDRQDMSKDKFVSEVVKFQDAVDAGALNLLESVDKDIKTRKFNEPF